MKVLSVETATSWQSVALLEDGRVRVDNVPSYRYRANVPVQLSNGQTVCGDIAWGGNWFYLCSAADVAAELTIELTNLPKLMHLSTDIREQLRRQGVTGLGGAEIDHVELVGKPLTDERVDARNFVLCPGGAYDRSPCGTGTSAKVACLAADGQLAPGKVWRQASIIGSIFDASYAPIKATETQSGQPSMEATVAGAVRVSLVGSAHVTAESVLILDPRDPFCMGIRA